MEGSLVKLSLTGLPLGRVVLKWHRESGWTPLVQMAPSKKNHFFHVRTKGSPVGLSPVELSYVPCDVAQKRSKTLYI